jgi:thiol-disulfide isomerase/thioredoxin
MQILKAMKGRLTIFGVITLTVVFAASLFAQEALASTSPAETDLTALLEKVNTKVRGAESRPANPTAFFADEITAFAELRTKYAGDKSEDVAAISYIEASFHAQVLGDSEIGVQMLRQLIEDFPGSEAARVAINAVNSIEEKAAAEERLAGLIGSPAPELDFTWATDDGLNQLSDLKGKVVVLDFWATWCGPCVRSFPQVRELTEHYADSAVKVVGVTSLQGRVHGLEAAPIDVRNDPAKEHSLMNDYIAKMGINWTIAFSQQEVFNPDYGVTGIPHMAIIAPDGTVRHRGLHPAMPHAEKTAMIDALLEEFDLPVPSA